FTAAKYYRLAEEHGNKTLGNSWYVSFSSSYLPLGGNSLVHLVLFLPTSTLDWLLGGALAVTPAISPMRLIGSRFPRGAQALFPPQSFKKVQFMQ
ncbi:hypothetical protein O181_038171, partial [Austropuccinia psidii MF-1]|nr:hypothetical protein [Austropuccinia psidii MF-1]